MVGAVPGSVGTPECSSDHLVSHARMRSAAKKRQKVVDQGMVVSRAVVRLKCVRASSNAYRHFCISVHDIYQRTQLTSKPVSKSRTRGASFSSQG